MVLEQHYVPGGWSHSFTLNGQRFSPGVHYVGLLSEGEPTNELYRGLGIANDFVFFRMNKNAYEHCYIGDKTFDLPAGIENLKNKLSGHFPEEEKNIHEYLSLVQKVNEELQLIPKLKGLWQKLTVPFRTRHFGKFALFTLKKVIGWHVKNPMLKAVLNIQCGDHGLSPNRACFPVHCSVMGHYFNGGYYPMGGGGIVKAMTNGIKKHGGEVRVQQNVQKIIIENRKAIGVQLENEHRIFAKNIISNADPSITYLKLIGKKHLSNSLIKKLEKTKYSVTSLILFLTLDMDVTLNGIDSGNFWLMKDENADANFENLMGSNITSGDSFPAVFMSCTTMKDPPSFNGRDHNFEIVTYINYEHVPEFSDNDDYHSEEYLDFKKKIVNKLLNNVEKIIPNAKNHIVQAELGTPKTNQFYINSTNGNVYGTEKTLNQVGPFSFKNKSEIENLHLCGACTLSHGVTGATYSGIAAAASILKCTSDDLMLADENQKIRIYDAEDTATWPGWIHTKRTDRIRKFV